eukprot:scaffold325996_cov124-Tisochrysis_lutea.AAC.1
MYASLKLTALLECVIAAVGSFLQLAGFPAVCNLRGVAACHCSLYRQQAGADGKVWPTADGHDLAPLDRA